MEYISIKGGKPLVGEIIVSGSKNAVLPLMGALILSDEKVILTNVPKLEDVRVMADILKQLGMEVEEDYYSGRIMSRAVDEVTELKDSNRANRLRASFLVAGALLAKRGGFELPMPGGCAIGRRPVDLHLKGFEQMGAEIEMDKNRIVGRVKDRKLHGARIYLDFPSVGATENLMMAGALAEGETIIENAASEPEICNLAELINRMGGYVKGAGTSTICINGVERLREAKIEALPDRVEAGTYMVAAALTGGNLTLINVEPKHLKPVTAKLREAGAEVEESVNSLIVKADGRLKAINIKTLPYPGFPTDMQAPIAVVAALASGTSVIWETIYENRFMHVQELVKMGANASVQGNRVEFVGVERLKGTKVRATDLRAGAALIVAGLCAEGVTTITEVNHIYRGYQNIVGKLASVGADIIFEA